MLNFLFCFDNNYNKQAFTSIYSLLSNTDSKLNFHIIHKSQDTDDFIPYKIKNHKNLNEVIVYKFKDKANFPNLDDVHVSEATYYRLFIQNYIKNDIEDLIYLDSDIICINNFDLEAKKYINKLKSSQNIIGAKTEFKSGNKEGLERFNISNKNYFNAGVLFIDYKKWRQKEIGIKLIDNLVNNKQHLKYWDQDLLNLFFNGSYIELTEYLNFKVQLSETEFKFTLSEKQEQNALFLHFSGKFKPWSLKGALNENSAYYHKYFKEINGKDFHIYNKRRLNTLKDLLKNLINFKIFNTKNAFVILKYTFKSLIRKEIQ